MPFPKVNTQAASLAAVFLLVVGSGTTWSQPRNQPLFANQPHPLINPDFQGGAATDSVDTQAPRLRLIPVSPVTSSEIPLDPNDYIGVDIRQLPVPLRQQIERAFLKHTGRPFSGSLYDPNSAEFIFSQRRNSSADMGTLRQAAERGVAEAQTALGFRYYDGKDVEQDYAEAARWWRKAAQQGLSDAQFNLGRCYALGEGVPQDLREAYVWFLISAAGGHASGRKGLDQLGPKLSPEQAAEAQSKAGDLLLQIAKSGSNNGNDD